MNDLVAVRRIFGAAKPKEPVPTLDDTTARLDDRGTRADSQVEKLDVQLAKYKEQIKKMRPGPAQDAVKRRALQVLKQKRLYEGQREQLYQQQFNVEQARFTVDSIKDTVTSVQAMGAAHKEMKGMMKKNKELNIDYIDKMQDNMFDMMDMTREINDAMGRSYDLPEDLDENDLMAELDALEDDFGLEESVKGGTPSYLQEPDLGDLPAAPATEKHLDREVGLPAQRA